jgi:hypothetical protein
VIALTLAEYMRLRASLPRGPFGPIWPGGAPPAVLIVEPAADVPRSLATAAVAYARRWRD